MNDLELVLRNENSDIFSKAAQTVLKERHAPNHSIGDAQSIQARGDAVKRFENSAVFFEMAASFAQGPPRVPIQAIFVSGECRRCHEATPMTLVLIPLFGFARHSHLERIAIN